MPITDYDGQLQTIARNLGEEPALTNTDGLLEAIAKGTENIITEDKLDDYLPLAGGTMTGDLEVNGSLTQGGKVVERVNASGNDYIRYESGLQICWGSVSTSGSSYDGVVTYPVPFMSNPSFQATLGNLSNNPTNYTIQTKSASTTGISVGVGDGSAWATGSVRWLAIGFWK